MFMLAYAQIYIIDVADLVFMMCLRSSSVANITFSIHV